MDGRKCIVYLPNHSKLDLTVHSKQLGKDLWRTIVHKLSLREEDYFGLKYKTTGEHYSWIQPDKRVLDHDIDVKSTVYPLEFIFSVRFFEDSVTVHKHYSTVEFVFLQAQNLMYIGEIDVPPDLSLELSALALQAFYGDFKSDEIALSNLKGLSCIPRSVILELPSLEYCEEQVISWYKNLCGFSRGQAVLLYMSKVERLPNYGVHFFKVKDKSKGNWWLGICNKGIYQYHFGNRVTPYLVFQWRNLEILHFREKKFSVEVSSGHKRVQSTGSTGGVTEKKAGNNQSTPETHTWYGSPALIKSIWTMAIAQHQFYLEKKQSSKSKSSANHTSASNLRNALDKNPNSRIIPPTQENIMQRKTNRKNIADSMPKVKRVAPKPPESPEVKATEEKMIGDLKKRKLVLEERLYDKVQELKEICKEEYNLTERLPIEYLRYMLPDESRPVLKKKIGAEYRVQLRPHPNRSYKHDLATATELQSLESDCELLNQIAKAAYKLAYDPSSKGKMKRKRLQSYQKALKKLQDMENRVNDLREKQGHEAAFRQSTLIMTSDFDIMHAMKECSIDEKSDGMSLSSGNNMLEDETSVSSGTEIHSTHSTPALSQRPYSGSADVDMNDVPIQRSRTPPPTKTTKLAWLESPMVKSKKRDELSPNGSYPVLPSPASYRSTTSHSSGTETPPHTGRRERRHRHHDGWKMSSLDSLDSIGSRKSNGTTHGSPHKHHTSNGDVMNANARRIARAAKSAQAQKVSLREKQIQSEPSRRMGTVNPVLEIVQDTVPNDNDSRTSLTDSGVVTDSRAHEEELARQQKSLAHHIRRDISDSSLSELSTQSNPAVLPSNIPKFVPYFMSGRNRAVTHHGAQASSSETSKRHNEQQSHVRKRSSSFTESGSGTLTRPTPKRDSHRTLNRSKTHNENENSRTEVADSSHANGNIPSHQDTTDKSSQPALTTSHSSNQLPAPIFDTNLNICKQYLSQSQGQLVQNNSNNNVQVSQPPESSVTTPGMQYVSVDDRQVNVFNPAAIQRPSYNVSANNSNNKLNFGQIYKLSQAHPVQNYTRLRNDPTERSLTPQEMPSARNVPKSNSLDSVLDRGRAVENDVNPHSLTNYSLMPKQSAHQQRDPNQYPPFYSPTKSPQQRAVVSPATSSQQGMSKFERDRYNNEAFQEIQGMGWVPSLDEYGSRASVAESLPAKSKREDIRELLQQHFAQNRVLSRMPSSSSTTVMRNKKEKQLQARIRAEMIREKESQNNPDDSQKSESVSQTWEDYKQNMTLKKSQNQGAHQQPAKHDHGGVNIFAHKAPPPLSQHMQRKFSPETASGYSVAKGYVNPNGYAVPDRSPAYPIMYDNNPDYGTIRSNKSSYSACVTTTKVPFERGYLSSTLPRKHGSRENSPQQTTHRSPDSHLHSPSQSDFPRTYSIPAGQPVPDPNFYPPAPYARHRHQHSADSLLTHSFTSPPHSFLAADDRRNNSSNQIPPQQNRHPGKNMRPLQQGQPRYFYQAPQQRSLSETWKQHNLVPVNMNYQHHPRVPVSQHHHHQMHHMGHHGMDPRASHEMPRRTASADDLLWSDGRDPNAGRSVRTQHGTLV